MKIWSHIIYTFIYICNLYTLCPRESSNSSRQDDSKIKSAKCNKPVLELDICLSAKYTNVFKQKALHSPACIFLYHEVSGRLSKKTKIMHLLHIWFEHHLVTTYLGFRFSVCHLRHILTYNLLRSNTVRLTASS